MKIVDAISAPVSPNPHGVHASMIHDTPDAQAVHITLKLVEALKLHATPVDVFFYILDVWESIKQTPPEGQFLIKLL